MAAGWLLAALILPALAQAGIGEAGARHLLSRTGFGANPAQIAVYAPLDREAAVDRLLAGAAPSPPRRRRAGPVSLSSAPAKPISARTRRKRCRNCAPNTRWSYAAGG